MQGTFSIETYHKMLRMLEPCDYVPDSNPFLGPTRSVFGMPVRSSTLFPFQTQCPKCGGSGEGETSTYCQQCKGQGENRYEGVMQNGRETIVLTAPLPKKFAPSFPVGLVPAPRLSRGLV
jgi:hypothetical protein